MGKILWDEEEFSWFNEGNQISIKIHKICSSKLLRGPLLNQQKEIGYVVQFI